MAFISISDGVSSVDAVVFPSTFEESKEFLLKDEVVIASGRIDKREEELSLVIENIKVFDPAKKGKTVEIYVPKGIGVSILQNINRTLRSFPGDMPVSLLLPNGGEIRRLNLPFTIHPDQSLEDEIKKLLGSDAFRVV